MRNIKYYWIVIFIASILIVSLYFYNFNVSNLNWLSNDQSDWASFGSYFGGVLGPFLAFLAYLGVREQLAEQKKLIDKQNKDADFNVHMERIRESFQSVDMLSQESLKPIELHLGIELGVLLKPNIKKHINEANSLHVIDDAIHAARLIQGAEFVYKRYLVLIKKTTEHLSNDYPLNEQNWSATLAWRQFDKRAYFLHLLLKKIDRDLVKPKIEMYEYENQEILIYLSAYETWKKQWQMLGLGF